MTNRAHVMPIWSVTALRDSVRLQMAIRWNVGVIVNEGEKLMAMVEGGGWGR